MNGINLETIGLTKVENEIYLTLIELGTTKVGPIIKRTGLYRGTIYDALKRLIEKGLANYIIIEKTKYYRATSPEYLLELIEEEKKDLKEKEKSIRRTIEQLKELQNRNKTRETAQIYQGKRGLKIVFEDALNYNQIFSLASRGKFKEVLGAYFYQFQTKKRLKKVKDKILISERLRGTEYTKAIYGDVRYVPKNYEFPTATLIYGNKVAIFVFTEFPLAFLIESEEVAKSYKSYFNLLWEVSIV